MPAFPFAGAIGAVEVEGVLAFESVAPGLFAFVSAVFESVAPESLVFESVVPDPNGK